MRSCWFSAPICRSPALFPSGRARETGASAAFRRIAAGRAPVWPQDIDCAALYLRPPPGVTALCENRAGNWWSQAGSNRRPLACHAIPPSELRRGLPNSAETREAMFLGIYTAFLHSAQVKCSRAKQRVDCTGTVPRKQATDLSASTQCADSRCRCEARHGANIHRDLAAVA